MGFDIVGAVLFPQRYAHGSMGESDPGITRREVRKIVLREREWASDDLAVEAPLQVRLAGDPFVVTMRTPGRDRDLVLGLLWAEGLIASLDDIAVVAPCGDDTIDVSPGPGVAFAPERSRRGTLSNASCGLCGREQIDDLLASLRTRARPKRTFSQAAIERALSALHDEQPGFRRTGAMHAAIATDREGRFLTSAEDVGRHNAVDKVVGSLLRGDMLDEADILVVSGRISFEIVQKAAMARLGAVVAVSGATSLAVDVGRALGMLIVGFARDGRLNVYAGQLA